MAAEGTVAPARVSVFAARLAGAFVADVVLVTLYYQLPLNGFRTGSAIFRLIAIWSCWWWWCRGSCGRS